MSVTNIISNNNVIALAYAGILTDRQTEKGRKQNLDECVIGLVFISTKHRV